MGAGTNKDRFKLNKAAIQLENQIILNNFKHQLSAPGVTQLPLMAVSKLPFKVDTGYYHLYFKETIPLGKSSSIDFIHHIEHVKDPAEVDKSRAEPHSFVWHSNAAGMREAVRWNLLQTEALTSQVIAKVGQYRVKSAERALEEIISNKYDEKTLLVNLCQDRAEFLQPIERLIHNYNEFATLEENQKIFAAAFDEYLENLNNLLQSLEEKFQSTKFAKYDKTALDNYKRWLNADIDRAANLKNTIYDDNFSCREKIEVFVREQLIHAVRQTQNLNQNITYSRHSEYALLRGDLNNYLEDAAKTIHEYVYDPHNPITKKHQGVFAQGKRIWFDSTEQGLNTLEKTKEALLKISFIEKKDEIIQEGDYLKSEHSSEQNKVAYLNRTYATKWGASGNAAIKFEKILAWIWNIAIGAIVGLLDLAAGLTIGWLYEWIKDKEFPSLAAKLKVHVKTTTEKNSYTHFLWQKLNYKEMSLGSKVAKLLVRFFKNITLELVNGVGKALQDWYYAGRIDIYGDYLEGFYKNWRSDQYQAELKNVLKAFDHEIAEIVKKEQTARTEHQNFINTNYQQATSEPVDIGDDAESALPAYHLNHKHLNDFLNSCANGWHEFGEVFLQEIFAKHPLAGVIFLLTYTAGGLAVMAPAAVNFLPAQYIAFSQTFGAMFAKSATSKAIASAFTQAKIAIGIYEGILHGPKSWSAKLAEMIEHDPSAAIAYTALAFSIGYLLAFECDLSYLSDYLREECGTVEPLELTFAGGKLVVLLFELIHEKQADDTLIESYQNRLEEIIVEVRNRDSSSGSSSDHSEEDENQKDEQVQAAEITGNAYNKNIRRSGLSQETKKQLNKFIKKIVANQEIIHNMAPVVQGQLPDAKNPDRIRQMHLLMRLSTYKDQLSHLNIRTKHFLMEEIKVCFPDKAKAFEAWLYPEAPQSILKTTIRITLGYIPAIFRALISLLPGLSAKRAWGDLGEKIRDDLTRVYHAAAQFSRTMYGGFSRLTRTFADIFLNEIVARVEGYIRKDQHSVATSFTYPVSAAACVSYEKACNKIGEVSGLYTLEKKLFAPDPEAVLLQYQENEHFWEPLLKAGQVEIKLDEKPFIVSSPTQQI